MSSQAGSSEVSKKLKAAIRAKLEELGVYVDDELPDYIMVMIANKKEKSQMKDDLSLFIGKSTAKFVDWLFDLFDRLQNASSSSSSKPGESSKKEEEKKKEADQKEHEDRHREEKHRREKEEREKESQREKEKERERERERQRERDREKRQEEERRREEKKREAQKSQRRRTRSRSNTYSDEEANIRLREKDRRPRDHRSRPSERKKDSNRIPSNSPEPQKMQSTVTVKRNIRATGDSNVKGRGTMFLRAMNEASVSAGYGGHSKRMSESRDHHENYDDDDMSDVDALPSKSKAIHTSSPKKSIRERMSRLPIRQADDDDDSVVLSNQPQTGGPQMIVKLSGGKEAIKRARVHDRIVVDDSLRRGLLKRKVEASDEPKSKHERIIFDIEAPLSRDSTPTDDSPTMQPWNGQIKLGDDSDSSDGEAEIDAVLAETRRMARRESVREEEEELPPTHQLSGKTFAVHVNQHYQQQMVPAYIPTPLSVLQEQQNQMLAGVVKEDNHVKERCIFWPKCTKGDACSFMHPAKNCTNFPNCTYGIRCLFIHPPCRFDRFCTKKHCPFTHYGTGGVQPGQAPPPSVEAPLTSNRTPVTAPTEAPTFESLPKPATRGALGSLAEKLAASLKKKVVEKKDEKSDENEKDAESTSEVVKAPQKDVAEKAQGKALPEIAPLQNMIPCRYAGGCRNPACHFKHPKECRFGANCRNPSCYFYHKPAPKPAPSAPLIADGAATTAKYKWTATTSQ